jgi:hypothetical protein
MVSFGRLDQMTVTAVQLAPQVLEGSVSQAHVTNSLDIIITSWQGRIQQNNTGSPTKSSSKATQPLLQVALTRQLYGGSPGGDVF